MWISVRESISIARPPEAVWDYTQDAAKRAEWDPAFIRAEALTGDALGPNGLPRLRVEMKGGSRGVFEYKLFDRPRRTSVTWRAEASPFVLGGGGSWSDEPTSLGTLWTQVNSIELSDGLLAWFARPLLGMVLARSTRKALAAAKRRLEDA